MVILAMIDGERDVPVDHFDELVERARQAAAKASVKFPQPNYVALKIAEEAGEVVRGAVHYAEGRMEWAEVEGEIVQLLAMLLRFVTEGDQVIGAIPPGACPPPCGEGGPKGRVEGGEPATALAAMLQNWPGDAVIEPCEVPGSDGADMFHHHL